jgi:hypothetical protein
MRKFRQVPHVPAEVLATFQLRVGGGGLLALIDRTALHERGFDSDAEMAVPADIRGGEGSSGPRV